MLEVSKVPELPRVKRRPKPLRELDQTARLARLRLEDQIFRPQLVRLGLRVTQQQLERVDAGRRVADSRGVPSRCAMIRALVDEGLAWRRAARPKEPPRLVRGEPLPAELVARLER
jgi:hypothetical protein